jgi:hypothetical protein
MPTFPTLQALPKNFRLLVAAFVITLNFGFYTGLNFVEHTTNFSPGGIQENYLGNEDDAEAEEMQFKKNKSEILTLIHNHVLSLSVIFFLMGFLLALSSIKTQWKNILIVEPFISLILTFGGIYILWLGHSWIRYIIILSGVAMSVSIIIASVIILREVLISNPKIRN